MVCLVCFILPVQAKVLTDYVTDEAGILSESSRQELNQLGRQLEKKTGAQLAVYIVASSEDEKQLAYDTFQETKLGNKNRNNGALLVIAMKERRFWLEVGTGLEDRLTDITAKHLEEKNLVPYFKKGDYEKGVKTFYHRLARFIEDKEAPIESQEDEDDWIMIPFVAFMFFFIAFFIFGLGRSRKVIRIGIGQSVRLPWANAIWIQSPDIVAVEADRLYGLRRGSTIGEAINQKGKKIALEVYVGMRPVSSSTLWFLGTSGGWSSGSSGFSGGGGGSAGGGAGGGW